MQNWHLLNQNSILFQAHTYNSDPYPASTFRVIRVRIACWSDLFQNESAKVLFAISRVVTSPPSYRVSVQCNIKCGNCTWDLYNALSSNKRFCQNVCRPGWRERPRYTEKGGMNTQKGISLFHFIYFNNMQVTYYPENRQVSDDSTPTLRLILWDSVTFCSTVKWPVFT